MAASATPRPTAADPGGGLFAALTATLLSGPAPSFPAAVAFSGGADSTALLLAAHRAWPGQLHAIHIHHGLQAAADDFATHCAALCDALGVPLHTVRVQAQSSPGESPEDAARRARYAALAETARAQGCATVLLGHHADDQVETLLLALSRGAGLPGLASMAGRFEREGIVFLRPLLEVPGPQLRQGLQEVGVTWVEDPTNAQMVYTRNRIRHTLLPALEAAFPAFRETFARSARHAAQAQTLLAGLATDDLAQVGDPPSIAALQALPRARQANVLRHWLRSVHSVAASQAQLEELLDQVDACRTRGHRLRLKVAAGFVERVDSPTSSGRVGHLAYHPA
ncbi:MAG: putative tRNA(Ile)-lysidine synthetase [Pseudomonadota bacterium]